MSKSKITFSNGRIIALVSAVILISCAILPWASTETVKVIGLEGDGIFTILIGVLSMVFLYIRKIPCWISTILGLLAMIVAITSYCNLYNSIEVIGASIDYGLYFTLLGSAGIIIGSIVECVSLRKKKK